MLHDVPAYHLQVAPVDLVAHADPQAQQVGLLHAMIHKIYFVYAAVFECVCVDLQRELLYGRALDFFSVEFCSNAAA